MDFSFTKEQQMIQKAMREFAEKELLPRYDYYDRTGKFPYDQWKKMAELGVTGTGIPEEYGGQPVDAVTGGLIALELARGDVNCAYAAALSGTVSVIVKYASEEIKQQWLPDVATGDSVVAIAVTEPHCGSDVAGLKMTAIKKGDHYILNGEKSGVTFMTNCDVMIVFALTDPAAKVRGVSCFLVPSDLPGITRQGYEDMGGKCIGRGSAFFDNVKLPEKYLMGKEGKGFYQVMGALDKLRLYLSLLALGAAEKSLEETMEYVKERTAFGKPLAQFEGISFPIAEHHATIETAKWFCFRTLWMADQGMTNLKEVAVCKYLAPKESVQIIHNCLLLHGHYGYTLDLPLEQRLRDTIALEIADGTAQIQKIIIARELMGRVSLPY